MNAGHKTSSVRKQGERERKGGGREGKRERHAGHMVSSVRKQRDRYWSHDIPSQEADGFWYPALFLLFVQSRTPENGDTRQDSDSFTNSLG